eukprot:6177074-Pleurochrysis_carterae.AAC.3
MASGLSHFAFEAACRSEKLPSAARALGSAANWQIRRRSERATGAAKKDAFADAGDGCEFSNSSPCHLTENNKGSFAKKDARRRGRRWYCPTIPALVIADFPRMMNSSTSVPETQAYAGDRSLCSAIRDNSTSISLYLCGTIYRYSSSLAPTHNLTSTQHECRSLAGPGGRHPIRDVGKCSGGVAPGGAGPLLTAIPHPL